MKVLLVVGGTVGGFLFVRFVQKNEKKINEINNIKRKQERTALYYDLLNDWMKLRNRGESLGQYFNRNGYNTIAIYGMGELGYRLYEELMAEEVSIACGIDKNKGLQNDELPIIEPGQDLDFVDVIVVTPIHIYNEIKQQLEGIYSQKIISLYDVVDEVEIMHMDENKSEVDYA